MKKQIALALFLTLGVLPLLRAAENGSKWLTSPEKAIATARGTTKLILVDFTGSDWCPPCIRLHREVFSQPDFQKFAKENLILVQVDFPRGKAQSEEERDRNEELAKKYGVQGFPTVIVLNSEGKQVGRLGYMEGGPAAFIDALKKIPTP
jgi:protein disulfide-isomerase